jgi:hypothetical protein
VAKVIGGQANGFHFVVDAFGDGVVLGKAPHASNLGAPGVKGVSQEHLAGRLGLLQRCNGAQETRRQALTVDARFCVSSSVNSRDASLKPVKLLENRMLL